MVDDDVAIRTLCARILRGAGLEAVVVGSAAEALGALSEKTACLVTDLSMPGMGGVELLRTVLASRPELPVLAMTGSAPAEELEELQKLKVEVLSKPFLPAEFVRRVRACLSASTGLTTPRPRRLHPKDPSSC